MHIRPFEIALIGFFVIAGLVGLFYISNYKNSPTDETSLYGESVVVWGTLSEPIMRNFLVEEVQTSKALEVIDYIEIDPRVFESTLINAIADGKSPDLIMIPHTLLVSFRTKLQSISF